MFLQKLTDTDNVQPFKEMILKGYGLVLMNTPIFLDVGSTIRERFLDLHRRVTFNKWLSDSAAENIKETIQKLVKSGFPGMVSNFFNAIRIGDVSRLERIIDSDPHDCLFKVKDYSGRSCLHLSVLYSRLQITKYKNFEYKITICFRKLRLF